MKTLAPNTEFAIEGNFLYLKEGKESYRLFHTAGVISDNVAVMRSESGRLFAASTEDKEEAGRFLIVPSAFLVWSGSAKYRVDPVEDPSGKWLLLSIESEGLSDLEKSLDLDAKYGPVTLCEHVRFWTIKGDEITHVESYDDYDLALHNKTMAGPVPTWDRDAKCYSFTPEDWQPLVLRLEKGKNAAFASDDWHPAHATTENPFA
ncbi:hypothetical protein IJG76_02110 [Candidatus Saccharibacteria bacterium]|nr:hypothetical protein [Candidatus Saccharibacteria bacterium]